MYTIEKAIDLGKRMLTASKTYGQGADLAKQAATTGDFRPLEAAIAVAVAAPANSAVQKRTRKGTLDVWTNTLKRVGQDGGKPEKGAPYLAFKREDLSVTVYWKTPEVQPEAAPADGGDAEAEAGDVAGISLEQALARIKQAYANEAEAEHVVNELRLMGLL